MTWALRVFLFSWALLMASGGAACLPAPDRLEQGVSIALPTLTRPATAIPQENPAQPQPALPLGPEPEPSPPPTPQPTPTPSREYGCPRSPCPRSLEYAVNGCDCAGEVYDESRVDAAHCCSTGFSDSECPESLQEDALREAFFGATQEEIEPQLVWIELQGWPVLVHQKAVPAFEQVNRNLDGVEYRIREPIDGYFWRDVEGHSVLSPHAYGIAVDIHPGTNPSCGVTAPCRCYNDLITDMPPEFVQAFKDAGFIWGGDWKEHPDPMHFEWEAWIDIEPEGRPELPGAS